MSQETKRTVVRVGAVVLLWVYITVFGVQPFLPHVTDKMLLVVLFFAGALTWAAATKKETAKTAAWVWAAFAILNLFTTFLGLPDTPFRQLSDGAVFLGALNYMALYMDGILAVGLVIIAEVAKKASGQLSITTENGGAE